MLRIEKALLFLKKRSKKLLSLNALYLSEGAWPQTQKFFGSFFQKRTAFFLAPPAFSAFLKQD
jgi:hypothetical protein